MKANLGKYAFGIFLLGAFATAPAQSIWNYFITDAGGGNSLVTWSVTGSVAAQTAITGPRTPGPSIVVSVNAPGIYGDAYSASGNQVIPTPEGSYFRDGELYSQIVLYSTSNTPAGGNDSFGLLTPNTLPGTGGAVFTYVPGTQSVLIPVSFSDFNPGTYQSVESGFTAPLTVNLTIGAVPEPSTLALLAMSGLVGALLFRHHRFQS